MNQKQKFDIRYCKWKNYSIRNYSFYREKHLIFQSVLLFERKHFFNVIDMSSDDDRSL